MAKLILEIEAEGERSELTEMLNDISGAMDAHPEVRVRFNQQLENNTLVTESAVPTTRVKLESLLDENSHRNARKAVTVLGRYSDIHWVSQVLEMSDEEILACFYFGDILLPELRALLNQAGYQW